MSKKKINKLFIFNFFFFSFWNYIVQFYPLWLAPNLITLIGLIVNLVTVLILSNFCFSATEIVFYKYYL